MAPKRGRDILKTYARAYGCTAEDERTLLVDVLTDLIHAAEKRRLNFNHCVETARNHHLAEMSGVEA